MGCCMWDAAALTFVADMRVVSVSNVLDFVCDGLATLERAESKILGVLKPDLL